MLGLGFAQQTFLFQQQVLLGLSGLCWVRAPVPSFAKLNYFFTDSCIQLCFKFGSKGPKFPCYGKHLNHEDVDLCSFQLGSFLIPQILHFLLTPGATSAGRINVHTQNFFSLELKLNYTGFPILFISTLLYHKVRQSPRFFFEYLVAPTIRTKFIFRVQILHEQACLLCDLETSKLQKGTYIPLHLVFQGADSRELSPELAVSALDRLSTSPRISRFSLGPGASAVFIATLNLQVLSPLLGCKIN